MASETLRSATEVLVQEHELIGKVYELAEPLLDRTWNKSTQVSLKVLFRFLQAFELTYHHMKEEVILFEKIRALEFDDEGGPLRVAEDEHQQIRNDHRALLHELAQTEIEPDTVRHLARRYLAESRDHMARENEDLFSLADEILPAHTLNRLRISFNRLDSENYTQFLDASLQKIENNVLLRDICADIRHYLKDYRQNVVKPEVMVCVGHKCRAQGGRELLTTIDSMARTANLDVTVKRQSCASDCECAPRAQVLDQMICAATPDGLFNLMSDKLDAAPISESPA